jgi:two-component system sensor kinase FixL
MADLLDILRTDEESLCSILSERLQRAEYESFQQTIGKDYGPILKAVIAFVESDDRAPARAWAAAARPEADRVGLSFSQFLIGLSGIEKVIRIRVFERLDSKKQLLVALRQLSDAVDVLRRVYTEQVLGGTDSGEPQLHQLMVLVDDASEPVCLASAHGKPFYLNRAARQILGMDHDEPIDASTLEPFHSEDSWSELCNTAVAEVNSTGCWTGPTQLRNRRTDELTDVHTKMLLVRSPVNNKPTGLAIVHRMEGDWEQLAASLRESEATKNAILESSLDPIITIDYEGKITEFNKAAEKVFGRSKADVLGAEASEVLFPEAGVAGEEDRIDRYLRAGEGSMLGQRSEVTAQRAAGDLFPVELAMTMTMEHGEPVMTFFVRDISERKAAEEAEARHREELERSNQELEQFAYVASHDLQEPLRKIRAFGERLESKFGDALGETGREQLQRIHSAADRMQSLIEGLLTLSRVTTQAKEFVTVDLKQVAKEVVSDLEVRIEEVGGQVEIGKLPTIQADPLQMRQLFQNLIGNALKFRREEEPPVVKIQGRFLPEKSQLARGPAREKQCRLTVEDNGIGFEQKYADRIFNVFQRLHPRDQYTGTGVGLAICKRIAERHGGTIAATSTPGEGTKFTVILTAVHSDQE